MQKLLIVVLLLAGIAAGAYFAWNATQANIEEDAVRRRVQTIFEAMAKSPPDEQTATCLWMKDKVVLERIELERQYDKWFDIWRAGRFAEKKGWTVSELERDPDSPGAWFVTVTAGGRSVDLWVPPGEAIELAG